MRDKPDPVLDALAALQVDGLKAQLIGEGPERWQIGDLIFSDAEICRLAKIRRQSQTPKRNNSAAMLLRPSSPSHAARGRQDVRVRILAVLTPEPATANLIAVRAGIPGRERAEKAIIVLKRLEADGHAVREMRWRSLVWRMAPTGSRSTQSK